jgi:DNA-binding NarL/FixJ family response regulator
MQRRRRRRTRARQLPTEALEVFERLGSRAWAKRARAELSQLGGRQPQGGTLTPTERQIAALVARGRSNPEVARELFISAKTVEWNLSKIYRKLHVCSRTELAVKLSRSAQG